MTQRLFFSTPNRYRHPGCDETLLRWQIDDVALMTLARRLAAAEGSGLIVLMGDALVGVELVKSALISTSQECAS